MSSVNSNVVDLVCRLSSGTNQPKPSFSVVKWTELKPTDPIVTKFAVWYFKKPIDQIPKGNLSRLKAMLRCFTLTQLQLLLDSSVGKARIFQLRRVPLGRTS